MSISGWNAAQWSALIATIALALSAGNTYVLWWRNRKADVSVRWEFYTVPAFDGGKFGQRDRIVIENSGPAMAREIDVRLLDTDRKELDLTDKAFEKWRLPVDHLHERQEAHLRFTKYSSLPPIGFAVVLWRDKRLLRQQREFWLTTQEK